MKSLTIAYITSRANPRIEWFLDSLSRNIVEVPVGFPRHLEIIVVARGIHLHWPIAAWTDRITVTLPKPNVWQGQYRLTNEDWFAPANARNTALCLCRTDYIAYVDDLSLLMPGWLNSVREAMAGGYIVCGAYKKVKHLTVRDGEAFCYEDYSVDCRLSLAPDEIGPCNGDWLYGCSCAMPVEDLLEVGGWPEICDGMGSEDYCLGITLRNAGKHLKYDKRMLTLESEEGHVAEPSLARTDKGISPNDKSHAVLGIAQISKYYHNFYPAGMRALREHMLSGGEWPIVRIPEHDWYDGQPISEMRRDGFVQAASEPL